MADITQKNLFAKRGASNILHATDGDDNITISHNMNGCGAGASNIIHLYDGADRVWIGGKMSTLGGYNAILGGNGQKNITIKHGMHAGRNGVNEISLIDQIDHYTAQHYLTIGMIKAAHQGKNIISTGDGDDKIVFTGHFSACYHGQNIITLGDGGKDLHFTKGMNASLGGKNIINMGVGNQNIDFGGSVYAGHEGKNQILSEGGNVSLHIKCNLETSKGLNDIHLGEGQHEIYIGGNIIAHHKGMNNLLSEGESQIIIGGMMKAHHAINQIETGIYDDDITIKNGLKAYHGTNLISTGDGHDAVFIKGHIHSDKKGENIVDLGDGHDTLYLYATVGCRDLTINAGEGYDTLSLSADNAHKFNCQYKAWFSDMYSSSALANSGIEEIRLDVDHNFQRSFQHGKFDWLTQMINQYNDHHSDDIAISLGLDNAGEQIDLSDIFTARDESSISILDLSGKKSNELRIDDTLASNGYDGNELRIDGDENDSVGLDDLWSASGGIVHENEKYYNVWENAYGESLLIQDGIDIHVY